MIITLINLISDKINEFKRRNRNKPSYYRLFLFWLTLIILISAVFYILNNVKIDKSSVKSKIKISNTPSITKTMNTPPTTSIMNTPPTTGIQSNSTGLETSDLVSKELSSVLNGVTTISQPAVYEVPKTELYHEVLNTVAKIPKPLNFVDDFDFKL